MRDRRCMPPAPAARPTFAGAGDDGDPELRIGLELVEGGDQFFVRHGMAGVIDLRPIDGDGHQTSVDIDRAVLAHGFPPLLVNEDLPQLETIQNAALPNGPQNGHLGGLNRN